GRPGRAGRTCGDAGSGGPYVEPIKTDTQRCQTLPRCPMKETDMFAPHHSVRHHSFKILASAALMLAASASFASAQTRSIGIDASDLDLASNAGRSVLEQRVDHA